jgi:hypothetical protein
VVLMQLFTAPANFDLHLPVFWCSPLPLCSQQVFLAQLANVNKQLSSIAVLFNCNIQPSLDEVLAAAELQSPTASGTNPLPTMRPSDFLKQKKYSVFGSKQH